MIKPLTLLLALALPLLANTDIRQWATKDGERFSAELVGYDVETEIASFKGKASRDFTHHASELSLVDQAWLKEWAFVSERLAEKAETLGGQLEHLVTEGEFPTELFIYHPSEVTDEKPRPLLILFHPGAKAQRFLLRFVDTAAELKIAVVSCGSFCNAGRFEDKRKAEAEFHQRFSEVLPQIEKAIPHDPERIILGGSSGGGWRAFDYTAKFDRPWLGVLSSGGWLGGAYARDLPYRRGMRVAIVNGNHDDNANAWVDHDTRILTARDCEVAVFAFEGGHQLAPTPHLTDALGWILEQPQLP